MSNSEILKDGMEQSRTPPEERIRREIIGLGNAIENRIKQINCFFAEFNHNCFHCGASLVLMYAFRRHAEACRFGRGMSKLDTFDRRGKEDFSARSAI
jgi:hypothetical protein